MFVRRSYRFRLYPTGGQREVLEAQLRAACDLYNAALEQRRRLWREHGLSIGYHDQSAELRELRAAGLLPSEANFWSQQEVLRRLDRAFGAFFRRLAAGETPGFPRFKSARRFDTLSWSFAGHAGGVHVRDGRLCLQAVGRVKVKWHRELPDGAVLREARVSRRPGGREGRRFYVCFQVELPEPEPVPHPGPRVGLDVGVRCFARLSSGEPVEGPRAGRRGAAKMRRLGRACARARQGSRRRRKAAERLARQRERERNRRLDHAHKQSRKLAERFALIALEDLNLRGMVRSAKGTRAEPAQNVAQKRGLNREIQDQAWGRFIQMLAYKAEEAGGQVIKVNPKGTSATCACCANRDPRSREGPRFRCVACGHTDDADTNAAKVILTRALAKLAEQQPEQGPGRGLQAPTPALAGVA